MTTPLELCHAAHLQPLDSQPVGRQIAVTVAALPVVPETAIRRLAKAMGDRHEYSITYSMSEGVERFYFTRNGAK